MSKNTNSEEGARGNVVTPVNLEFPLKLLSRINYHKSMQSSENAISTLKRINPKLNEMNVLTLAYLSQNEALTIEERAIYLECLKAKSKKDYETWRQTLQGEGRETKVSPTTPSF